MLPRPTDLGLSLILRHGWRSLAVAVAAGLAFGLWMVLADATVLRGAVPAVQHEMVARLTTLQRIALAWRGALFDEVVLRWHGGEVGAGSVRTGRRSSPRPSWPGR